MRTAPVAVGEADSLEPAGEVRLVLHVERPVRVQPHDRLRLRRIEHDAARVHEQDAIGALERPGGPLLRQQHRTVECPHRVEEPLRAVGVELRRRLVEQQQARPKRQGGSERRRAAARRPTARAPTGRPALLHRRARAPPRRATRSRPDRCRRSRARKRPRSAPSTSPPGPPDPGRRTQPFPRARRAARHACRGRPRPRDPRTPRRGSAGRGRRARAASVDLPEPDGPSSTTCSPSWSSSETPSSAGIAPGAYA